MQINLDLLGFVRGGVISMVGKLVPTFNKDACLTSCDPLKVPERRVFVQFKVIQLMSLLAAPLHNHSSFQAFKKVFEML